MVWGGTPSKDNSDFWVDGNIPWVSPKDMYTPLLDCSQDYITESAVKNSSTKLLSIDSILFVTRSGVLRHTLPISRNLVDVTINQDIKALTVTNKNVLPSYLHIYLSCVSETLRKATMKVGTTVESLDFLSLKKFKAFIPNEHIQNVVITIDYKMKEVESSLLDKVRHIRNLKCLLLLDN